MRLALSTSLAVGLFALSGCAVRAPSPPPPVAAPAPELMDFVATAYTITGTTASGMETKPGIVAADPHVLPLGTRIRVHEAGPYSGVYTVADTGAKVKGRRIDIFLRDDAEAKRFGEKRVKVERLDGAESASSTGAP